MELLAVSAYRALAIIIIIPHVTTIHKNNYPHSELAHVTVKCIDNTRTWISNAH